MDRDRRRMYERRLIRLLHDDELERWLPDIPSLTDEELEHSVVARDMRQDPPPPLEVISGEEIIGEPADPDTEAAWEQQHPRHTNAPIDLVEFLHEPEPEYDWVVPGILERGDRFILTGGEGGGKSTLLQQLAIMAATGIHPFNLEPMEPIRVLLADFENGRRHLRRKLRQLWLAAEQRPDPGWIQVISAPAGLDLLWPDHSQRFTQALAEYRPSLLIAGPLYKMAGGDPKDEEVARQVAFWIDRMRALFGCAVAIEAHSPYAASGSSRPERPYGASLWSRWPEFGLHLSKEGALRHWRGARDERSWPAQLSRGGSWPWTVEGDWRQALWVRITDVCEERRQKMSVRALAEALTVGGQSVSKNTVSRVIGEHQKEWDRLYPTGGHGEEDF